MKQFTPISSPTTQTIGGPPSCQTSTITLSLTVFGKTWTKPLISAMAPASQTQRLTLILLHLTSHTHPPENHCRLSQLTWMCSRPRITLNLTHTHYSVHFKYAALVCGLRIMALVQWLYLGRHLPGWGNTGPSGSVIIMLCRLIWRNLLLGSWRWTCSE